MISLALASLLFAACAQQEPGDEYSQQALDDARAAVPTMQQLQASEPQQGTMSALGDPAIYPKSAHHMVIGINGAVEGIVLVMRAMVLVPPSQYNSATKEFSWGPWKNDDGHGWVAAYIKKQRADKDFKYVYALMRGHSNDAANMTPVIWGGANPHATNRDYGSGITLWDFEANRAFEEAHDPDFDPAKGSRGRFIALYAKGEDEAKPHHDLASVVAVFRNFVPEDKPDSPPADLNYLYGHYKTPRHTIDFLGFETAMDVSDPKDGVSEDIDVRMAFMKGGTGRAEADAAQGSLISGQSYRATECWDSSFNETYLLAEVMDSGSVVQSWGLGEESDCGDLFVNSLTNLQIPRLQDIDAEMLAALDQVAEIGTAMFAGEGGAQRLPKPWSD